MRLSTSSGPPTPAVAIPDRLIAAFCRRWKIRELEVFGSVLRDDFRPGSDIDLLVTFAPHSRRTYRDYIQMERELREIFGREVDFVERRLVEQSPNWVKRREILSTRVPIYVEG